MRNINRLVNVVKNKIFHLHEFIIYIYVNYIVYFISQRYIDSFFFLMNKLNVYICYKNFSE